MDIAARINGRSDFFARNINELLGNGYLEQDYMIEIHYYEEIMAKTNSVAKVSITKLR